MKGKFMKMVSRIMQVALIFGVISLAFISCGNRNVGEYSGETIVLKLSHTDMEDQITGQNAAKFAELVNEYTKGRVQIEVYPLGQLGTSVENCEGVQMGTIDLTILMPSMTGLICEDFNALDTPFIYSDRDESVKVSQLDSPAMVYLSDKLEKTCGVTVLYSFYCGTRQFTSNKEIYEPDHMKGLNLRSLTFEVNTGLIDALGGTAVQIDITELQQALSSGQVDGQENPADVIVNRQLYENQKYLIMTGHMSYCQQMVINSDKWNSISEDDQALILKAAQDTEEYMNKIAYEKEDEYLEQLVKEHGMTVIDESNGLAIETFRTQVSDYFHLKYGKKYAEIYSLIEKSK